MELMELLCFRADVFKFSHIRYQVDSAEETKPDWPKTQSHTLMTTTHTDIPTHT